MTTTIRKGYKQTEIGVIPEDWEVKKLGDVCTKIQDGNYGGSYPKSNEFLNYGIPFLTSKAIGKDGILKKNLIDYISADKHSELIKAHLQFNDILFTNRGASVGAIGFVEKDISHGNIGPQLTLLRVSQEFISSKFLFHIMKSEIVQKQISSQDSGSAMNFFGIGATKKFLLLYPLEKSEQSTIATILSDTDVLIEHLDSLIAKKKAIKQGAMQQLLIGKKRLSGFSGKWEMKKLGEILKVRHGKDQKQIENTDGQYPILGTGGLMGYTNLFLYNKPSVLIGRKGTIDKPQFMNTPFWTVDTLFYTEIFEGYDPKFIFHLFKLIDWYSFNEASGVPSLNAKTIEKIEKTFPTFTEQSAIATILSDMDCEIESLEREREKYTHIKQGMMQQLLTGNIRIYGDK